MDRSCTNLNFHLFDFHSETGVPENVLRHTSRYSILRHPPLERAGTTLLHLPSSRRAFLLAKKKHTGVCILQALVSQEARKHARTRTGDETDRVSIPTQRTKKKNHASAFSTGGGSLLRTLQPPPTTPSRPRSTPGRPLFAGRRGSLRGSRPARSERL